MRLRSPILAPNRSPSWEKANAWAAISASGRHHGQAEQAGAEAERELVEADAEREQQQRCTLEPRQGDPLPLVCRLEEGEQAECHEAAADDVLGRIADGVAGRDAGEQPDQRHSGLERSEDERDSELPRGRHTGRSQRRADREVVEAHRQDERQQLRHG